jgi:hypothetical protein
VCSLGQRAGERAKLCDTLMLLVADLWAAKKLLLGPR